MRGEAFGIENCPVGQNVIDYAGPHPDAPAPMRRKECQMVSRMQVIKACMAAGVAALAALLLFMLIHTWVMRAADPALAGATTTVAAFITGLATYLLIVRHRAG
jgi:hypothetical protein